MGNTDTQEKPRRKHFRLRRPLISLLLLALLMGGMFLWGASWGGQNSTPQITADIIGQQLHDIQELAVVEYHYTNMGRFENQLDFYGWQVPFTTKRFIVSYDGVIKAGIDLNELKIEVRTSEHRVIITLPQAKILSHVIPEDSIEVFDETRNIFNPISINDYTGFSSDQKSEVEQKAIDNGLLTQAAQRAAVSVRTLLSSLPGMEAYTLEIQ